MLTRTWEWWAFDERGWSAHRVSAQTESDARRIASATVGGVRPYAFGEVDVPPSPGVSGAVESRLINHADAPPIFRGEEWVARPVHNNRLGPSMGRFYR